MVGHAHAHDGGGRNRFGQAGAFRDQERERSGPEPGGKFVGNLRNINGYFIQFLYIANQEGIAFSTGRSFAI